MHQCFMFLDDYINDAEYAGSKDLPAEWLPDDHITVMLEDFGDLDLAEDNEPESSEEEMVQEMVSPDYPHTYMWSPLIDSTEEGKFTPD